MKNLLHITFFAALLSLVSNNLTAQSYAKGQTYTITTNTTFSGNSFPDQCDACVINISNDATLTISKEVSIPNIVITGGKVVLNKKTSLWGTGQFTDVTVSFKSAASFFRQQHLQ